MPELPEPLQPLFERLELIYGAPLAARIRASMSEPKRAGFFVNPLVAVADLPDGEPVPGLPGCFSVAAPQRAALLEHDAVASGAVYPLNPSSALAVHSMDLAGVEEVLDLAAAPGGKTLLLAAAMDNRGRIAAVEPVKGRFHRMRANLARSAVTNVSFYLADGRGVGRKVPERFDRVLLDAPCSSEARIRLDDPSSYVHWKRRKVGESARKQKGLIRSGYRALKPGGEMLYCTCSFAPEENELVVAHLLAAEQQAQLLPATTPGMAGLTGWQGRRLDDRLALCRRILPDDLWDGFFLARIRKGEA
jgi:16S rRNA (cytosine1407-C5)-methyltransferase